VNYINWHNVRARWESGESSHKISKANGGRPTRQGIDQKAKREKWLKGGVAVGNSEGNVIAIQSWIDRVGEIEPAGAKDSQVRRAMILQQISIGAPKGLAAEMAGTSPDSLARWCERDADFAALVEEAEAAKTAKRLGCIDTAIAKGDTKAAQYMLERDKATRAHFAQEQGKPSVNVTINVQRGEAVTVEGETIDG